MADQDQHYEEWLDTSLRDVDLPGDLVARLKAIPNEALDAALRNVPVPTGLIARLQAIPQEEPFDQSLRDVPVPEGLLSQLRAIPTYPDQELDERLRNIPASDDLLARISGSRSSLAFRPWTSWATAAMLLIAIGLSYFGAMTYLVMTAYHVGPFKPRVSLATGAGVTLKQSTGILEDEWLPEMVTLVAPVNPPEPRLALAWTPALATSVAQPTGGPMREMLELFEQGRQAGVAPLFNIFLAKHPISANPTADVAAPEVELAWPGGPRGVAAPTAAGFDLLTLLRDGVFPPVSPGAQPELEMSRVPLVTSSASYEHLWRRLGKGRLPEPRRVRVEEFLAAVQYDFPLPRNRAVGIRTAAGPAPFGANGASLLQIAVQAGRPAPYVRPTRSLTVAVDVSSSMAYGDRLRRVLSGIRQLTSNLGPRDYLTLVTFDEEANVLVEHATRADLPAVRQVLQQIRPQGATNLVAGLHEATSMALQAQLHSLVDRRMILITDAMAPLAPQVIRQLETLVADTQRQGVPLDVVQVAEGQHHDPALARMAQHGAGRLWMASEAREIGFALDEILVGRPQLVAEEVQLELRFNPATVASYRLVGHEPDPLSGPDASRLAISLRAGETSSALYEIRFQRGANNDVGTATLRWRDPLTGQAQMLHQPISYLQFATSLLESPLSLQRAACAAEFAQVLQGTKSSAAARQRLDTLIETASRLPATARQEPSFRRLIDAARIAARLQRGQPAPAANDPVWTQLE